MRKRIANRQPRSRQLSYAKLSTTACSWTGLTIISPAPPSSVPGRSMITRWAAGGYHRLDHLPHLGTSRASIRRSRGQGGGRPGQRFRRPGHAAAHHR